MRSCCELYAGKVLGMLGNVQLELQKLVDSYVSFCLAATFSFSTWSTVHLQNFYDDSILSVPQRSHIALTITRPSESLLNELRTVEVCLCTSLFVWFVYSKQHPTGSPGLIHMFILSLVSTFPSYNSFQYFNFILFYFLKCLTKWLLLLLENMVCYHFRAKYMQLTEDYASGLIVMHGIYNASEGNVTEVSPFSTVITKNISH